MKRTIAIWSILAILPMFAFAQQEYRTPSGLVVIQDDNLGKNFIQWILPNGNLFFQKVEAAEATTKDFVVNYIERKDGDWGVEAITIERVADCESQFNPEAVGDHGLAYGVLQFHKQTFDSFKAEADMPYLEYKSWQDQIDLGYWAFGNGKKGHWSCK